MEDCKIKYRLYSIFVDSIIVVGGLFVLFYATGTNTFWKDVLYTKDISVTSIELLYIIRVFIIQLLFIIGYIAGIPAITKGQTLGMYIFKIAYINEDGSKCEFGSLFVRNFLGILLLGVYSMGFTIILSWIISMYRRDKRSLSDIISKTRVVDKLDY